MDKAWIYSQSCLDPEKHGPLIDDIYRYAAMAGLGGSNMRHIWEPIEKHGLSEEETLMLKNIKKLSKRGQAGALYVGQDSGMIADRFMALTGCMVRNYVDARYVPLERAIDEFKEQGAVSAAVACIPNFHTDATCLKDWRISLLYDLLLQHMSEGKLIIGYVQDMAKMETDYPATMCAFLKANFLPIGDEQWN